MLMLAHLGLHLGDSSTWVLLRRLGPQLIPLHFGITTISSLSSDISIGVTCFSGDFVTTGLTEIVFCTPLPEAL